MGAKDPDSKRIENFEDLLKLVGTTGWRNYAIFIVAALTSLINPLHVFSYQFIGGTPDYRCSIQPLRENNWTTEQIEQVAIPFTMVKDKKEYSQCEMYDLNYESMSGESFENVLEAITDEIRNSTEVIQCDKREFDSDVETIVTKWDLVCSRRAIYSTTQAAVHGGMLVGSLSFGYIIDRFGRALIYKCCVVLYICSGFIGALSVSIEMFIAFKVISSTLGMGYYMAGFVLCMEMCSQEQRTMVGNYFVIPWAFGMMIAAGISYVLRPWRYLQALLTFPAVILLISFWILPESPRWLIIKGRFKEAYEVLKTIATSNKRQLPAEEVVIGAMEEIKKMNTSDDVTATLVGTKKSVQCVNVVKSIGKSFFTLVQDPKLRGRTFAMFFCWFCVSLVYYGVSLVSTALSTDPYFYLLLGGLVEFPCYVLLWPIVSLMGRKKAIVMFYFLCALGIASMMFMIIYTSKDEYGPLKTALSLTGKFGITAAFHLIWVYTAELYPTELRSLAIGGASTFARVGSICSPYISDILGEQTIWAPAALFTFFSLAAGAVAMVLPETSGTNLPDSVKQTSGNVEAAKDNPGFTKDETSTATSENL